MLTIAFDKSAEILVALLNVSCLIFRNVENVNICLILQKMPKCYAPKIKYSQYKITYKRDPNYFQSFQYIQYHVFH